MSAKARVIAFYLPQFHPTPENDEWWGKGFTEWTNVGKAKPLFKGHYQPKVPRDLGYYDLRVSETRVEQANLAKYAGIEGFCYWHYWFAGKRLLDRVFREVLETGKPDFPFCLTWANHSWKAKTWLADGKDKMLMEQTYPGVEDYKKHFYEVLPAFKDNRYIRVNNKPLFGIYAPNDIPDVQTFISLWNKLAEENGLDGIYFLAYVLKPEETQNHISNGFNAVTIDYMATSFQYNRSKFKKIYQRLQMHLRVIPKHMPYHKYVDYLLSKLPIAENVFPCILPNFDHSPRSSVRAQVLTNSTPEIWRILVRKVFAKMKNKSEDTNIVFIKAWNEWAEGNYLEPDLKYGKEYINVLKDELENLK